MTDFGIYLFSKQQVEFFARAKAQALAGNHSSQVTLLAV